jgi:hypothetical protein
MILFRREVMPPDLRRYPAVVQELLSPPRLSPLDAGTPNSAVRAKLAKLRPVDVVAAAPPAAGRAGPVPEPAACCLAGLWLYHDFLDESHRLSQEIETPSGSFWHGIMHRREGDFENAKYWFRRVGKHPAYAKFHEVVGAAAADAPADARHFAEGGSWDPFAFVDLCRTACNGRNELEVWCRRVQADEWRTLFDFCFEAAAGSG